MTTPSERGIRVHEGIRRLGLVRDVEDGEHKDFAMSKERLTDWTRQAGLDVEAAYTFELGLNVLVTARARS